MQEGLGPYVPGTIALQTRENELAELLARENALSLQNNSPAAARSRIERMGDRVRMRALISID